MTDNPAQAEKCHPQDETSLLFEREKNKNAALSKSPTTLTSTHVWSHRIQRHHSCPLVVKYYVVSEGGPSTHLIGCIASHSLARGKRVLVSLVPNPRNSATSDGVSCCRQHALQSKLYRNCTDRGRRTQRYSPWLVPPPCCARLIRLSPKARHTARYLEGRSLYVRLLSYSMISILSPTLTMTTYVGAVGGNGELTYSTGVV